MSWLMATIYDGFMERTEAACLRQWRTALLAEATGRVLEVGAGTGANLGYYPPAVTDLVVSEPDAHMRRQLLKKQDGGTIQVSEDAVGALNHDASSFDTVVSTLVLCSVDDPSVALRDVYRVLKPGGRLLFLEHVAAQSNPGRLKWQRRVEPIWKHLAGNCHVTRDTEATIRSAGFVVDHIERESMRQALPWIRPTIRGCARKN